MEGFDSALRSGDRSGFDPYGHRKYRHCVEALEDAFSEFECQYTHEQIRGVFETHLKDDYSGYIPIQSDFEDGTFKEKYHENDDRLTAERILSRTELNDYFKGKFYALKDKRRQSTFQWGFWLRILLPTLVAVLLFVTSIFVLILPQVEANLLSQKKLMIRELTTSTSSVIRYYIGLAERGELSKNQAQAQAVREISSLRYGKENKDYFWITDMHPCMIMHPYRRDLIGEDLTLYTDNNNKSGKHLFVESVKIVREANEGYLEYYWQWKDDPTRNVPKLSYVKGISEWRWILGTGVYIDDVSDEIQRLTRSILFTFAFITLGLVIILLYIVRQSLRIENDRKKAESGLVEAKERYRALVEASNEAYVLELEGEHVYSNRTFQRLLGYSEEASLSREIWSRILPNIAVNEAALSNLHDVFSGKTVRGEIEARLCRKNGQFLDVIMRVSRIFFSSKNGHVICLRPIVRSKTDMSTTFEGVVEPVLIGELSDILDNIRQSESEGHVIRILNGLPTFLGRKIHEGIQAETIRHLIADVYHETVKRYIDLALRDIGEAPVKFTFLSLGSAARREMTLFSDQDNALIFADGNEETQEATRDYFLGLANRICEKLNQAGYPFCQGGIMAANPKWCLSLSEWKENVAEKFKKSTPESILEVNIFLDFYPVYGDLDLAKKIQKHMFLSAESNPVFFKCYAQSCLDAKLPLSVFGQLKTENKDGVRSLNIKDCLAPIVLFARIYALKHKIAFPATADRLHILCEKDILQQSFSQEMIDALNYFWRLRLYNQMNEHSNLRKIDDALNIDELSEQERLICRQKLSLLPACQRKISYDFLGIDPMLVE